MREITAPRVMDPKQASDLVGTRAAACEPTRALNLARGEDAVMVRDEDGVCIAAVGRLDSGLIDDLHRLLPTVNMSTTLRGATGYKNVSATFGYAARKPVLKREACRVAALNMNQPEVADTLQHTARWCGRWMADAIPEVVEHDKETLKPVLPDWRLDEEEGSLWTSGVINKDSPMPYHRDGSNFPTWSAMPVVRAGVRGGALSMPEHNLVFPCADGTVLFWWGQRLVHGVTPMRHLRRDAYRYTIVYYALRGMKDCATYARETALGQQRRTAREESMAARIRSGEGVSYGPKPLKQTRSLGMKVDRADDPWTPIVEHGQASDFPGPALLDAAADATDGDPQ